MCNKWLLHLNRSFVAFCISTNYFSPVKDRAALIAVVFPVSEGPKQTTIVQPAYNFVKVLIVKCHDTTHYN